MLDRITLITGNAGKAADAYAQLREPVLVDDTGLIIHGWNGLPGALVAWFLDTAGQRGLLPGGQHQDRCQH